MLIQKSREQWNGFRKALDFLIETVDQCIDSNDFFDSGDKAGYEFLRMKLKETAQAAHNGLAHLR